MAKASSGPKPLRPELITPIDRAAVAMPIPPATNEVGNVKRTPNARLIRLLQVAKRRTDQTAAKTTLMSMHPRPQALKLRIPTFAQDERGSHAMPKEAPLVARRTNLAPEVHATNGQEGNRSNHDLNGLADENCSSHPDEEQSHGAYGRPQRSL